MCNFDIIICLVRRDYITVGFHNFSGNEAVDGSIVNLVFWEVLGDLRFLRFVLRFFITVLDFKDSITNFQCSGL